MSELEEISNGNFDMRCFSGWRNEIFGKKVKALIAGQVNLGIYNSEVILKSAEN